MQEAIKRIGPVHKKRQAKILGAAHCSLELLTTKNLARKVPRDDHINWLKAKEVMLGTQNAKLEKLKLLARKNILKKEEASCNSFLKSLQIKKNRV